MYSASMSSATYSPLQIRLLNYFTEPNHPERHTFLNFLRTTSNVVLNDAQTDAQVISTMRGLIERNPTNACTAGLDRLKRAFPEFTPAPATYEVTFTTTIVFDRFNGAMIEDAHLLPDDLRRALTGAVYGGSPYLPVKDVVVDVASINVERKGDHGVRRPFGGR